MLMGGRSRAELLVDYAADKSPDAAAMLLAAAAVEADTDEAAS